MSQEKMFLVPVEGRRVKDPITMKLLDAAGEEKPVNAYWMRRLKDGDVREGQKPQPAHAAPKARNKAAAEAEPTPSKES